jgi:hypothetical protein
VWTPLHFISSRQPWAEADQDPVLALLATAPVEDEPVSEDDRKHIADGWQAYRDGRVMTEEEVKQGCRDSTTSSLRPPRGN